MSRDRRRGLPDAPNASAEPRKRKPAAKGKGKRRRRGIIRTVVRLLLLWVVVVFLYAALFIGTKCYTSAPPAVAPPPVEAANNPPGYVRGESFTYLTLPEWYIVYSADEYAAFLARNRPSAFPYFGAARQYWGYYATACDVTKRSYGFDTGYHAMLGVIGASFTIENSLKLVYENTVGRLTERLSSMDTAEDAFARRTAQEYGAFMHTIPWYEFPFAARLRALWQEVPWRGAHMLRKLERRFALTLEYGVKAGYGWLIGKASGAAYDAEEQRIHARIDNAPPSLFSDARVKEVKRAGAGAYAVTLPRYEAFTRTVLALTAQGVRFVDIAGNDDILITVLARRGISLEVPESRVLAARPILTDPTMQRLVVSVPVSSLRAVAQHFARERAAIEHVYDY